MRVSEVGAIAAGSIERAGATARRYRRWRHDQHTILARRRFS